MTLSQIVFFLCLLFILGIFLNSFFNFPIKTDIPDNSLRKYNDTGETIILTGRISQEPDVREKHTQLILEAGEGKILVFTYRFPEYNYGDRLEIKGELETPEIFEDFNYQGYLSKDGIYSIIYFPQVKKIEGGSASLNFYSLILGFKSKLRKSLYENISPPQSAILGAIILGDKKQISEEYKEKLNITGTRHITCVSGLHIVLLAGILMWLGMALGLWKSQAFYFAIVVLFLYIIMIGAPASAVRAGIMGGLFLLAEKTGRMNKSDRALVLAAALMLFYNPLLLRYDVGFQLSFLATLGIIHLMPFFQHRLKKIPLEFVRNILAMTFSAYVFTLPILIYNFGYVSLVSPIANVLIVPLLPFIMIFGLVSGLVGIFWQFLGWIFSLPNWFFLTYIVKTIDFFSQLPVAFVAINNMHWLWVIVYYLVLVYLVRHLNQRQNQKLKFLKY